MFPQRHLIQSFSLQMLISQQASIVLTLVVSDMLEVYIYFTQASYTLWTVAKCMNVDIMSFST